MKNHLQPSLASIQLRLRRTSLHPLFLLLSLIFFLLSSSALAEIRYVSKTGSSTPPYTSWETAADSIQKCIDISGFGDTIYVANGVYKEKVVMIPGLSLIGAGSDSCVINTQTLVNHNGFIAVDIKNGCLVKGFKIIVYYNANMGIGISMNGNDSSLVIFNTISTAAFGIYANYTGMDVFIKNNYILNIQRGVDIFNSNALLKNNHIITSSGNTTFEQGIHIEAFDLSYSPIIDSNYIEVLSLGGRGINKTFGSKPIITNNIIKLKGGREGIFIGYTDSTKVYNNLIIGNGIDGIVDGFEQEVFNNTVVDVNGSAYKISGEVKNNIAINSNKGIESFGSPTIKYNNSWNNEENYSGFTPDSTNLSVNPMVVNDDTSKGELDFHLQMFSPLIDAGDPSILDIDGSRSDIGLFGGPYGEKYTYRDLAPKPPSNLTAEYDSGLVKLTWNRNTEADFFRYRVYRDTVPDFMYDTTKIIAVLPDTIFYDELPEIYLPGNYYYKVTALDSTGHQSAPSEEVHINITGVPEGPPVVVEHYQLLNNYPNPFNPSTIIPYRLKEGGHVKLVVYTTLGEEVAILVDHYQPKGYYEAEFNPTNYQRRKGSFGNGLSFPTGYNDDIATGIYIYRLIVSDSYWETKFVASGKMILLR